MASTSDSNRLKRAFGPNLPIVEATVALRFTVLHKHFKGSVAKNALCCAIANALGGTDVAVLRTYTFIRSVYKGKDVVMKYQNGAAANAFIQMFDAGMRVTKPVPVVLLPVPETHRAASLAKRHQRRVAAKVDGEFVRAYRKPSLKVGKVVIAHGTQRVVVVDKSHRCATRYISL